MRIILALATLALLPLAAPSANAAHAGACWHEYAEAALWAATHPRERPFTVIGTTIDNCNERLLDQVCFFLTGNRECVMS